MGQLIFNGLVTGLIVALPALALTLTFGILRFANFAIGGMITVGAYVTYVANTTFALPLAWAALAACGVFAMIIVATDRLVFRPLRDRSSVTLLVASIGVSFVFENVVRLFFGSSARSFDNEVSRPFRILDIRINNEQIIGAAAALVAVMLVHLLLHHTRLGRAMRAVADNPMLASVRGIDRDKVIAATWAVAGVLICLAGVLIGMDRGIDPLVGWNYVIPVFAAAILGGLGRPFGAVVGALCIGVVEELATLVLQPSYRHGVGFVVIALFLLLRPQGLFGKQEITR